MKSFSSVCVVAALVGLSGCAGAESASDHSTVHSTANIPRVVSRSNISDATRLFYRLDLHDGGRETLRDRIMEFLVSDATPALEHHEYDEVVRRLEHAMSYYSPEDFEAHHLSTRLEPLAQFVVDRGSPRGDEGSVLGALRILANLHADGPAVARYQQLATWGQEVRENIPNPNDRYSGLVRAWEQHAKIAPAGDALDTLSRLYVERRNALLGVLTRGEQNIFAGMLDYRSANIAMLRAPYDVAAVYLAVADFAQAHAHVRGMGSTTDGEARLAQVIQVAGDDTSGEAGDALMVLATGFLNEEIGRPDVAEAVCRYGERHHTNDARFPHCLARVSAVLGEADSVPAYYIEALSLTEDKLPLYDEALTTIEALLTSEKSRENWDLATRLSEKESALFAERIRLFPNQTSHYSKERLELVLGQVAMEHGLLEDAENHFKESIAAHPTGTALLALGSLYEHTSRGRLAVEVYRQALDLIPVGGENAGIDQAAVQVRLANAFRVSGDADQARRIYTQALDSWKAHTADGGAIGFRARAQVGIIEERLGNVAKMKEAFEQALADSAADTTDYYAQMLSYLVMAQNPDPALAFSVYESALHHASLTNEWKTYFALWAKAVAERAHVTPDPEIDENLRRVSEGSSWIAHLARFGAGDETYEAMLAIAATNGVGQQAEAHFYEAMRRFGAGDQLGAIAALHEAQATHMVTFFEFDMASEILRTIPQPR